MALPTCLLAQTLKLLQPSSNLYLYGTKASKRGAGRKGPAAFKAQFLLSRQLNPRSAKLLLRRPDVVRELAEAAPADQVGAIVDWLLKPRGPSKVRMLEPIWRNTRYGGDLEERLLLSGEGLALITLLDSAPTPEAAAEQAIANVAEAFQAFLVERPQSFSRNECLNRMGVTAMMFHLLYGAVAPGAFLRTALDGGVLRDNKSAEYRLDAFKEADRIQVALFGERIKAKNALDGIRSLRYEAESRIGDTFEQESRDGHYALSRLRIIDDERPAAMLQQMLHGVVTVVTRTTKASRTEAVGRLRSLADEILYPGPGAAGLRYRSQVFTAEIGADYRTMLINALRALAHESEAAD